MFSVLSLWPSDSNASTAAGACTAALELGGLPPGGEQQAHGVNELLRLEGFGDVEDAAQLLRLLVGLDLLGGGEEADGDVRGVFGVLQLGAERQAVKLRHLDVEQDGVGLFQDGFLKSLFAVAGGDDRQPVAGGR